MPPLKQAFIIPVICHQIDNFPLYNLNNISSKSLGTYLFLYCTTTKRKSSCLSSVVVWIEWHTIVLFRRAGCRIRRWNIRRMRPWTRVYLPSTWTCLFLMGFARPCTFGLTELERTWGRKHERWNLYLPNQKVSFEYQFVSELFLYWTGCFYDASSASSRTYKLFLIMHLTLLQAYFLFIDKKIPVKDQLAGYVWAGYSSFAYWYRVSIIFCLHRQLISHNFITSLQCNFLCDIIYSWWKTLDINCAFYKLVYSC